MKGIILVGGKGSRLYPLTISTHKQLLPVYDKPMIYYSLSTLMEAGIRDVLIISTKEYAPRYKQLLGDGSAYGMKLSYTYEPSSRGIAQAFTLGEEFIGEDDVCLILGDNIFLGDLKDEMHYAIENASHNRATIFGYQVGDPERFGVVEFDETGKVISLEEKPQFPKSNIAQTGLYVYPNDVIEFAKDLKPSARNCDEQVEWLDAGTKDSLIESSIIVRNMERQTGRKFGCIDEVAYKNKWINKDQLLARAAELHPSDYSKDLLRIAKGLGVKTNKR